LRNQLRLHSKWKKTVLILPLLASEFTDPENQSVFQNILKQLKNVTYLSTIIFGLDNRGTGGRGKAFENLVYGDVSRWSVNDQIDYLFIGAGPDETNANARHQILHEQCEEFGIKHEYVIRGAAHNFITWRELLYYNFIPSLWRTNF